MEAKLTPMNRLEDATDKEVFERIVNSASFEMIQARIKGQLKRYEDACVREENEVELRRAQGAVMALRTALEIPKMILDEMIQRNKRITVAWPEGERQRGLADLSGLQEKNRSKI